MDETNSSLTERLCALFGSYKETVVSVMPFRGGAGCRETEMWVIPSSGSRRTVSEYVSGAMQYEESFKLMLRYPAISPADRLRAVELLERVMEFGVGNASGYGISITEFDSVKSESDSSEGVFSLTFSVRYTAKTNGDAGMYYIAFPGSLAKPVGVGVTEFTETVKSELFTRRHIHEDFTRSDAVSERREFKFEFDSACDGCALSPLHHGAKMAEVYKVSATEEAEMTECVLSSITFSCDRCSGILTVRGGVTAGRFDKSMGIFTKNRMAAMSEVIG